jgi:hypothetical protein
MRHTPFNIAIALGVGLAVFAGHALAQAAAKTAPAAPSAPPAAAAAAAAAAVTDSVIGSTSALDRTRPFKPGEKLAYFTNIKDGDKVKSPFRVAFAVSGMGISPVKAGPQEGTGHHHILINTPMPVDIRAPIPFDKPGEYKNQRYKHFGGGETETVLDLPVGKHTLRLLFADHTHVPYYVTSNQITIEVTSGPVRPEDDQKAPAAKAAGAAKK